LSTEAAAQIEFTNREVPKPWDKMVLPSRRMDMDTRRTIQLERVRKRMEASDADLSGSTFMNVSLAGAEFKGVNLAEATVENANLSKLRISNANLSGA